MSETKQDDSQDADRNWRSTCYEIIFEADTPAGKTFDVLLLIAILLSVLSLMLESVDSIQQKNPVLLRSAEWFFTILFTIEYSLRIACAPRPLRYIFSFYGVVDLLAILPTYLVALPIFHERAQGLSVIRALRLLRAFRIFKLAHMLSEAKSLREAIWASRAKIAVFLTFILISVVIVGSAMHLIERGTPGFDSIPESMYWAIVTMTTVGYGDISPVTPAGKTMAACMMMLGYCMIIVPTGIVSAEIASAGGKRVTTRTCPNCMSEGHDQDAQYCKYCSEEL